MAVSLYFAMFWNMSVYNPSGDEKHRKVLVETGLMLIAAIPPTLIGIRWRYLVMGELDLRTLLVKTNVGPNPTKRIGATDPRDRVYALLGIANDAVAKDIVANYTLPCEQAYIMTARALLQHGHDDILSLCRTRGECKNLPSWVPDWSAKLRVPWTTLYDHKNLFKASGQLNGFTVASNPKDVYSTNLSLTSTCVDIIKGLGHSPCLGDNDDVDWVNTHHYFQDIRTYLASSTKYTKEQKAEAEWRIPVGDTDPCRSTNQTSRATATSAMQDGYAAAKVLAKIENRFIKTAESDALGEFALQLGAIYDSRPFISKSGYVGLCPLEAQPGDAIAIFKGARVPYVIRKAEDKQQWTLIGESHVYGIMDGEFMTANPPTVNITLC
jgi:hypothetical protein